MDLSDELRRCSVTLCRALGPQCTYVADMTDDGQSELIPCKRVLEVLSVLSSKQSQHSLASLLEDFASSHEQCTGTGTSSLVCYTLLLASELQSVDASPDSLREALETVEKVFITVCQSIAHDGNVHSHKEAEEAELSAVDSIPFEEHQPHEERFNVDVADDVDWFFDTSVPDNGNSNSTRDDGMYDDNTTTNQYDQKNISPCVVDEDTTVPFPLNIQLARGLDHSFPWEFEFTTSTDEHSGSSVMGLSLPMRLAWTAAEIMWGPLPPSSSTTHHLHAHAHRQTHTHSSPVVSAEGQGLDASIEPLSLDRMILHTLPGISSTHSGVYGDTVIFLCDRRTAHASVAIEGG